MKELGAPSLSYCLYDSMTINSDIAFKHTKKIHRLGHEALSFFTEGLLVVKRVDGWPTGTALKDCALCACIFVNIARRCCPDLMWAITAKRRRYTIFISHYKRMTALRPTWPTSLDTFHQYGESTFVFTTAYRRCCKLASALFIAGKKNRMASFGLTSPARIRHARHKAVLAMLF